MKYIVENSGEIPEIKNIRYSVSKNNATDQNFLNFYIKANSELPYTSVTFMAPETIQEDFTFGIILNHDYTIDDNVRFLSTYHTKTNAMEYRTTKGFPKEMFEPINVRDTCIVVTNWNITENGDLFLMLRLGKGNIVLPQHKKGNDRFFDMLKKFFNISKKSS